jgi:hypothetical protein
MFISDMKEDIRKNATKKLILENRKKEKTFFHSFFFFIGSACLGFSIFKLQFKNIHSLPVTLISFTLRKTIKDQHLYKEKRAVERREKRKYNSKHESILA